MFGSVHFLSMAWLGALCFGLQAPVEIALGDAFLGMQRIETAELCLLDPPELFLEPLRSKQHQQPSPQHSSNCAFPCDMPNKPCLDPLAPEVVDPDNQPELAQSHESISSEVAGSESGNQAQLTPVTAFLVLIPVTAFLVQWTLTESGPQQQLIPVTAFLVQWTLTESGPQPQLITLTAALVQWAVQQQQAAAAVAAEASEATEAATPEALEVAEEAEVLKVAEALEAAEHPESPGSDLARASTAASSSAASSAPSGSASSSGLNPNAPKFRSGREVRDGIWMHVARQTLDSCGQESFDVICHIKVGVKFLINQACPYEQIGLPCLTRPGGGCLRCDHFKEAETFVNQLLQDRDPLDLTMDSC